MEEEVVQMSLKGFLTRAESRGERESAPQAPLRPHNDWDSPGGRKSTSVSSILAFFFAGDLALSAL